MHALLCTTAEVCAVRVSKTITRRARLACACTRALGVHDVAYK